MTNIIEELPVTAQDIKMKSVGDEDITKMKEALKCKQDTNSSNFPVCMHKQL